LAAVKSDLPKAVALKTELQKREKQIVALRNENGALKVMLEKQKRAPALSGQNNAAVRILLRMHGMARMGGMYCPQGGVVCRVKSTWERQLRRMPRNLI
jgi:hypothetical protein